MVHPHPAILAKTIFQRIVEITVLLVGEIRACR
jgi:hypothetical protein